MNNTLKLCCILRRGESPRNERMQPRRTLDCAVSSGDGGVRTMDMDRVRLRTGGVGASRADGTATLLSCFFSTGVSSTVRPSGRGVVEGKATGGCLSGEGTVATLGLCELERCRFALLFGCRGVLSPFGTGSLFGSMKPTAGGGSSQVASTDGVVVLTVCLHLGLMRELAVVPILAVTGSKRGANLSWVPLRTDSGSGSRRGTHVSPPS